MEIFSEFMACPKCFVIESLNSRERVKSCYTCSNCQNTITFEQAKTLGLIFEDLDFESIDKQYTDKLIATQKSTTDQLLKARIEIELRMIYNYKMGSIDGMMECFFNMTLEDDSMENNS